MARRDEFDIVADMLTAIQDAGKLLPTRLMYKSNLSHPQLKKFLAELLSKGLVEKKSEKKHDFLSLTSKGHEFINNYRKAKEFEQSFGLFEHMTG